MKAKLIKGGALAVGLLVALAAGGCNRDRVAEDVSDLKQTGDQLEQKVREGMQSAKAGAEKVKEELPAATERAREELAAATKEVKATLDKAGEKVRQETAPLREALQDEDKK